MFKSYLCEYNITTACFTFHYSCDTDVFKVFRLTAFICNSKQGDALRAVRALSFFLHVAVAHCHLVREETYVLSSLLTWKPAACCYLQR